MGGTYSLLESVDQKKVSSRFNCATKVPSILGVVALRGRFKGS